MYRTARPKDRPAILALWRQVFGDGSAFIQSNLNIFAGEGNVFLAESGNSIAAQLLAVPCAMGGKPGVYMYALATQRALRGQGLMTGLMQYAEAVAWARGAVFAALIPAGEDLYAYYKKRGYTNEVTLRELEMEADPAPDVGAYFAKMNAERFAAFRQQYVGCPYVDFSEPRYELLLQDLYGGGARTISAHRGYAVYYIREEGLFVPEMFTETDAAATKLLGALAARTGKNNMRLTLAGGCGPFAGQGTPKPAGLWKGLDPAFTAEYAYMRFGFDEIA